MYGKMKDHLSKTLAEIKEAGLYKEERLIESAQQAAITVKGKEVLNFCANNYLGLSNHPRLIAAAQNMMERRGYGMFHLWHTGHPQGTGSCHFRLLQDGRHHSICRLLRCQRRCVRTSLHRRGRHYLRFLEPCFHH